MHSGDVTEVGDIDHMALNAKYRASYDPRRVAGSSVGADFAAGVIEMDYVAMTGDLKIEGGKLLGISPDTGNRRRCIADEPLLVGHDPGVVVRLSWSR